MFVAPGARRLSLIEEGDYVWGPGLDLSRARRITIKAGVIEVKGEQQCIERGIL
jgi:hypothetical protein